jgi:transcriptional regulator with PAS, ATPase and Fis domain
MRKILKNVYKIAPTTSTVLITGKSGSGKEFLANVIHRYSKRSAEPFVAVNCGAIPENLVESELFGAKKGSFTGSTADKKGLFESANGGTLFLDEVGELSASTQVKLLRFLQNHEIRRVGETEARYLDVRVIAATNRDLQQAMYTGTFREDLYYRLNTFHLHLPPLRERKPVIPTLIRYFILKYKETHGKEILDLEPAAQYALTRYPYPGNIRELENIVEHAIVLSENGIDLKYAGCIATIDIKKDEEGLRRLSGAWRMPLITFDAEILGKAEGDFSHSDMVLEKTGVDNVCERAAVLAAGRGSSLVIRKTSENGMTIAVAERV